MPLHFKGLICGTLADKKLSYFTVFVVAVNPLKCSGIRWLHLKSFNAIQV